MEEAKWTSLGRRRRQLQGVWKRDGAGEFAALKPLRDEQLGRGSREKWRENGEVLGACLLLEDVGQSLQEACHIKRHADARSAGGACLGRGPVDERGGDGAGGETGVKTAG